MTRRAFLLISTAAFGCGTGSQEQQTSKSFEAWATAHAQTGATADGGRSRVGVVAADPAVLPLGSRIRVSGAGEYSGVYLVKDTGPAVKGRTIDIYMPTNAEARRFGRKRVSIEVLEMGGDSR
jgi:3D (Asp-Asp-Asp) domain-containing protein